MAVTKSADKRHRQSLKRRMRNKIVKSTIRSFTKDLQQSVESGNKEEAEVKFGKVQKLIDSAKRKGILHANTANRKKSRLALRIQKIS